MNTDMENRNWKGNWIWDVEQPELSNEQVLVYFRKTFKLSQSASLQLELTADSRYILFVNGERVLVGPSKSTRQAQYVDTVDVSKYLKYGKNVIAVKVLRYPSSEPFQYGIGGPTSIWRSQSAGLLVEGELLNEQGQLIEGVHSDASWKVFRHRGYNYRPSPLIFWMGGLEEVYAEQAPLAWNLPQYDDVAWDAAIPFAQPKGYGLLNPWRLKPRSIPFLYEQERSFIAVHNAAGIDGADVMKLMSERQPLSLKAHELISFELDAGELTTGYIEVSVQGGKGSVISLLCAEGYDEPESTPRNRVKKNRENTSGKLLGDYDVYHVSGESLDAAEVYEPFWFRTFRYVRVEIQVGDEPLQLSAIQYRETGYPLEVRATFQSSDSELNHLWDLSLRTLKRCMHETYEDCPYYEQLQYTMDSRLMMLFTYNVSADDRLPRRTIEDFYQSRMSSGLLQSRYPSTDPQVIPSFSLYWIDMLLEHYQFNGSLELIYRYRPAILELMDWFHSRMTEDGIVGVTSNEYWTYFDWVDAWPLGAPPESKEKPMILLSLMYGDALRKASFLLRLTGWNDVAEELHIRADQICKAVVQVSWSEESNLFRELPETEIYTQHSQIMAVLAGAIEGEEAKQLMKRTLTAPLHKVTLPFSYLLMKALKKVELADELFPLWNRWRVFQQQGLTTLPETEVNPRSDCHAWSSVPLAEFPSTILGVSPAKPGFEEINIHPVIDGLQWAKGVVPTVKGLVKVDWKVEDDNFSISIESPDGVPVTLTMPNGSTHAFTNDCHLSVQLSTV